MRDNERAWAEWLLWIVVMALLVGVFVLPILGVS